MSYNTWGLKYNDLDIKKEKSREALLTVGNGYLGTRGSLDENLANEVSYPGTYISGLYNKLTSKVAGKNIQNEDFVNCPNWVFTTFKINDDDWFNLSEVEIESITRELNFKNGLLSRQMIIKDRKGRKTKIVSNRFASMANPHLISLKYAIKPLNYSGKVTLKTGLIGDVINEGVERYKQLNQKHLEPVNQLVKDKTMSLIVETTQSKIIIAQTAKTSLYYKNSIVDIKPKFIDNQKEIFTYYTIESEENSSVAIQKTVGIYTSKNDDVEEPLIESQKIISTAKSFDEELKESAKEWNKLWDKMDIEIDGDDHSQMLIRLHIYHLLTTSSPHNADIDFGIPARGLHGEAYRGHIFWDQMYILPFYDMHLPETAKSILKYRYNRLDKAREYAKKNGYKGAMFPWQSGSEGVEETQVLHLNPISGKWDADYSSLQRHVSISVAYNVWYYYNFTEDYEFLKDYGAEIFFEICRFWASKSRLNKKTGKYDISKVMGPDEFHEKLPNDVDGGLKNNSYTNIMVAWLFTKAIEIYDLLKNNKAVVLDKIYLLKEEILKWKEISEKITLEIDDDGIFAQFDGYPELKELDWDKYKEKYVNIHRLDRILKAEGKSPDDYKVAKQADVLMIFYLLPSKEVEKIISRLGYKIPENYLEKNFNYYLRRTSHGSTLSMVVHAYLAQLLKKNKLAWDFYNQALESDYIDIQGGTTAEGIHAGVMGSTVLAPIRSFIGINFMGNYLILNPDLPKKWEKVKFKFLFKNNFYHIEIDKCKIYLMIESDKNKEIKMEFKGKEVVIKTNFKTEINY